MPRPPTTDAEWLARLESDDEQLVISALHNACPCRGSAARFEQFKEVLARFQKDSRPKVRAVALHLEHDAFEELTKEDEVAAGWIRNRPGGNRDRGDRRRRKRS